MAQKNINIGSSANKGDGDPLRTAFSKAEDNFTELYSRLVTVEAQSGIANPGGAVIQQSIIGSVIGEDSTTIIDHATSTIIANKITGDLTGSVVADDSTVLIDGVSGTINAGALTGALPAIDGSSLTGVLTGSNTGVTNYNGATLNFVSTTFNGLNFSDLGTTPTTLAGYGITDGLQLGTSSTTALAGDTTFSFASLTGKPTTIAGYGITDATSTASPAFTGAVDFTGATSVDFTGATISGTSFLTSYTETDPVVGAITGIVKSDGSGNISAAVAGTDYLTTVAFSDLTGTLDLDDNEEVRFGTDNDMRIYHSGTTGNIDNNTGSLIIDGSTVRIQDGALANTAISASNGIATLLFENSAKLATSTDGVAVTGKITGLTDPTDAQDAATKAYVDANAGGSGLQSRTTKNGVTGNLIDGNQASVDITGFKGYALLKVYTSRAARVRIYTDDASRTADASRAEGTDPTADAGVVAEVITTTANETVLISPGAFGFNNESTPTTTIPTMITNKSGSTQAITVTLTLLQLES